MTFKRHVMNTNQEVLHKLESNDASLRNKAALKILDDNLEELVPALAAAVARSTNIGANGTLVYALGHFDCSRYFELLFDVALHHKYEASGEAFSILLEQDFNLSKDQLLAVKIAINETNIDSLTDFQQVALDGIRRRFFGVPSDDPNQVTPVFEDKLIWPYHRFKRD
jgi:hypothetical protein